METVLIKHQEAAKGTQAVTKNLRGNKGDGFAKGLKYIYPDIDVITDADFTYPAQYVPEMIRVLKKLVKVGMVCGKEIDSGFSDSRALHDVFYLGNRLIAFTHNVLNGVQLEVSFNMFACCAGNKY